MTPARKKTIDDLIEHLDGEGPPLVITGSRGAGKSRLLEGIVHALSGGKRTCLVKRVEQGGRNFYDSSLIEDVEQEGSRLLRGEGTAFRVLRTRRAYGGQTLPYFAPEGAKLYLLVDGLDHMMGWQKMDATLLPPAVPPGMRLVISVSHGPVVDALAARGWRIHEVAPLEESEQRHIVAPLLRAHARKAELTQALLVWPHSSHPIHLAIAATMAAATGRGPAATEDVAAVVRRLLDERRPNAKDAALLALAEYGVPQFRWRRAARAIDRAPLESLVVERCGLLQPALPEVREALRARCTDEDLRAGHLAVFEEYGDDNPYYLYHLAAEHLLAHGDAKRMASFVTRMEPFQTMANTDIYLLERCWRAAGLADDPGSCDRVLEAMLPGRNLELRVAIVNNTGLLAEKLGWKETALRLKRRALAEAKQAFPVTHAKVGVALYNLAMQLQWGGGDDAETERTYLELLAIYDLPTPVDEHFPTQWYVLECYAGFLAARDRFDESLARREEAIAAVRRTLGERHPRTARELLGASGDIRSREPGRALSYAETAYDILRSAFGPKSEEATSALRTIAWCHLALGQREQALATSQRALETGQAMVAQHPREAAYALDQLADLADAEDDHAAALAYRQRHYDHYRKVLGLDDASTLYSADVLARRHEAAGEIEKALELQRMRCERYLATKGPDYSNTLETQVDVARVCWRLGRRAEAERRLDEWAEKIEASSSSAVRTAAYVLRSEWAREDGRPNDQRRLLEQALALCEEKSPLAAQTGLCHVLLAGNLFLTGEHEASARHHEAGLPLLDTTQRHLQPLVLRRYARADLLAEDGHRLAARRRDELAIVLAVNGSRPRLARVALGKNALRLAWHPTDGRTLAVLDEAGRTRLFHWHPESGQLERVDAALGEVALPKNLAAFTLRWSTSGQALCLHTPELDAVLGEAAEGDTWTPASRVSPDGRFVLVGDFHAFGVVRAPGKP
jgi:tetratricopeptide (TPR) repeat protein